MARKTTNKPAHSTSQDSSFLCLQYIKRCGGSARLSSIHFSIGVIQTLINNNMVKINNTGAGIYVEVNDVV
ncbi:hypothetical protein WKK05_39780 (plasmid) [Nostoc sp. UHCC 0302]|uniref:hypothetical protein n=1 Tax=Nostoc sp. UHCC 0302 TaxID=3134896 RepID=UPI00311CDBA3